MEYQHLRRGQPVQQSLQSTNKQLHHLLITLKLNWAYLEESVEVHEDRQDETQVEEGELGGRVSQPICHSLHSAGLLVVLVTGEVGFQSRVLVEHPIDDTLQ